MDLSTDMFSTFDFEVSMEAPAFGFEGRVKVHAGVERLENGSGRWDIGLSSYQFVEASLTYWRGGPRVPNGTQLRQFVRKCLWNRKDINYIICDSIEDYMIEQRNESLRERAINDWEAMQFDYEK